MSAPVIPGIENLEIIGHGGFSVVYRGWQREMGRDVAVKVISSRETPELTLDRWRREVTAMGRLSNHPNIVSVYAGGMTDGGFPYLVMPYVPDGSLGERLRSQGPVPAAEAAVMGAKLAGALASAHAAGILHRDVKPDNVLLSQYGEPQLTDFGIARLMDRSTTTTGQPHASIAFAAPEILDGRPATEATDVYSLGATLFAALSGTPPFSSPSDESMVAVIGRIATQPAPDPRQHGVPDALAAVIESALAKRPEHRIATADELRRRLDEAARMLGTTVHPAPTATVALAADAPAPWRPRDDYLVPPDHGAGDTTAWGSSTTADDDATTVSPTVVSDDATTVAPVASAGPAASRATAAGWRNDDATAAGPLPRADAGAATTVHRATGPAAASAFVPTSGPTGPVPLEGRDDDDGPGRSPLLIGSVAMVAILLIGVFAAMALFQDPADETATEPSVIAATSTTAASPTTASTRATTTTAAPTTTTTAATTTTAPAPPAGDPGGVATSYFNSIGQKNLAGAYGMLTPEFRQAQSQASFVSFWGGFSSVQVSGPAAVSGNQVSVPMTIDGRPQTYNLTMVNRDGTWMIDGPRPRA